MAYIAAEARQRLLDEIADATDELGRALAALGAAYELLDEHSADRLEEQLFSPVQRAYGRAKRTHAEFAARHRAPERQFTQPSPGPVARDPRAYLQRAVEAVEEADALFVELQDSMMPVQVGDPELRAGHAEVRSAVAAAEAAAPQFLRTLGR
jgi:hypothetical protein